MNKYLVSTGGRWSVRVHVRTLSNSLRLYDVIWLPECVAEGRNEDLEVSCAKCVRLICWFGPVDEAWQHLLWSTKYKVLLVCEFAHAADLEWFKLCQYC